MNHKIARILRVLLLISALILPARLAAEPATGNTLPAARTLTSADGRTIDVVITTKTATSIKAKKADGKEFEIALDKLSEVDRAFVAGLVAPAMKKPRLLYIGSHLGSSPKRNELLIEKLKAAGFDIHTELSVGSKLPSGTQTSIWPGIDKMSDQQIKDFDVVWEESGPRARLLPLIPTYQGAMVMRVMGNDRLKDFVADQTGGTFGGKPHVDVDGCLIRYYDQVVTWKGQNAQRERGPVQPEFIDQTIEEVQKLLTK